MDKGRFLEIEHKFVVGPDFDLDRFRDKARRLAPTRTESLCVEERYFLLRGVPGYVYRYKMDEELQLLTVKSFETDPEVRFEVSLDLGHHAGDQSERVVALLESVGIAWRASIEKKLEVFYFSDCEVAYYEASTEKGERTARCVEIEATDGRSEEAAREVLLSYERHLGFVGMPRSKLSLVELLHPSLRSLIASRARK